MNDRRPEPRPLKLLSVADALVAHANGLPAWKTPAETVALLDSAGRVLAEEIVPDGDVPGFDRSTVDGYAVRAADTFGASEALPSVLGVVGDIRMGVEAAFRLDPGQAARIPTGGMLPGGADAVVMLEYAEELDQTTVALQRPAAPGENVLRRGEDMAAGRTVLGPGHRLRAQDIGALAALGRTTVEVHRRPRVAIVSSGDEIVPPDRTPGPAEVRDINAYGLAARVIELGAEPLIVGIIRDDYDLLLAAARSAMAGPGQAGPAGRIGPADILVISGGSSVGSRDATARVIEALGPPGVIVHGVAVKPGKPTILGLAAGDPPRPVFGLPGHPASAMVVFELFVRPVIGRSMGLRQSSGPAGLRIRARLAENVASSPAREEYVRVRLAERDGSLVAVPILGKSGLISTLVQADGLLQIPLGRQGYEAGQEVTIYLLQQ